MTYRAHHRHRVKRMIDTAINAALIIVALTVFGAVVFACGFVIIKNNEIQHERNIISKPN